MDYEKAYKEALERAKKLKAGFEGYNANVAIIEKIFPELAESENERAARIILDLPFKHEADYKFVKAYLEKQKINTEGDFARGYDCGYECCIHSHGAEWFEKQKEQNPLSTEETELNSIAFLEQMGYTCIPPKEHKQILEVFGFKVGDAVRLKDGDGRKHIIKSFEEVKGIHGPNFYLVEFEDDSARDGIYPGEGYPNGYYTHMEKFDEEQKPVSGSSEKPNYHAEWSEEDEKRLESTIHRTEVICGGNAYGEIKKDIDWLKSLRPQPKQEDRYMEGYWKGYKDAQEANDKSVCFHYDNPNIQKLDPNVVIQSTTDGTYIPQPHWKPSEE